MDTDQAIALTIEFVPGPKPEPAVPEGFVTVQSGRDGVWLHISDGNKGGYSINLDGVRDAFTDQAKRCADYYRAMLAVPASGKEAAQSSSGTPRTKRECLDAVVKELNLDTTDSFTCILAAAFALQDAYDDARAALVRCQEEVHQLSASSATGEWINARELTPRVSGWRWIEEWNGGAMVPTIVQFGADSKLSSFTTYWRYFEPPSAPSDGKADAP